jgi:ADP-ribose pyrophosphatase YjhB (NUDIX family)
VAEYLDLNYCSQCGGPLENRLAHGRTRRYCPVCDRVVFRDPKVAAGMLATREDGAVLLVRRRFGPGEGLWSIPAGFVEYDEAPSVTAVRECREETGLGVALDGLLDVIAGERLPGEAAFLIVYHGQVRNGELRAGDDADRAAFFALDDLPPLAFASTRAALRRWSEMVERRSSSE